MSILATPVRGRGTVSRLADILINEVFRYPAELHLNPAGAEVGVVELGAVSVHIQSHPGVISHKYPALDGGRWPRGSRSAWRSAVVCGGQRDADQAAYGAAPMPPLGQRAVHAGG